MSETIHDAVAAYALGALDADEARAFEAHLAECPACRAELAAYEDTVAAMSAALPVAHPPAELRERVLGAAREARAPEPVVDITSRRPAAETARVAPRGGLSRFAAFGTAAAAVVAAVAAFGWWSARDQVRDLRSRVANLEAASGAQAAQLAARDSLLATVLGVDAREARLASTDRPPSARLIWSPARGRVVLSVAELPPAPTGRTYQLWGIPEGGAPVSLGVFDTGDDGRAVVALPVPAGLDFAVTAVTEEPAGGSPGPTTQPFLVGRVSD